MSKSQIFLTKEKKTIIDHRNLTKYSLEIPNSNFKDLKLNSGASLIIYSGEYDVYLKRGILKHLHNIYLKPAIIYKVEVIERSWLVFGISFLFFILFILLIYITVALGIEGSALAISSLIIVVILITTFSYIRLLLAKIKLIEIGNIAV